MNNVHLKRGLTCMDTNKKLEALIKLLGSVLEMLAFHRERRVSNVEHCKLLMQMLIKLIKAANKTKRNKLVSSHLSDQTLTRLQLQISQKSL